MEKSSGSGSGEENTNSNASSQKETVATTTASEQDVNPFEEYMWMSDPKEEDEVHLQAMEEIVEDEFIEYCFEDMLEEEALGLFSPPNDEQDEGSDDAIPSLQSLSLDGGADGDDKEEVVAGEVSEGGGSNREATWKQDAATPSGFGGQSSESENSDSDSLGDSPQR